MGTQWDPETVENFTLWRPVCLIRLYWILSPRYLQDMYRDSEAIMLLLQPNVLVDCVWNVMTHAQKPDFVFRQKGRIHLNRRRCRFSRLLAAEVCASTVVMLDTPCSEVMWDYWLPTPFASFPFTSSPVSHRVPSHFNSTLLITVLRCKFVVSVAYTLRTRLRKVTLLPSECGGNAEFISVPW